MRRAVLQSATLASSARSDRVMLQLLLPHMARGGVYIVEDAESSRQTQSEDIHRYVYENFVATQLTNGRKSAAGLHHLTRAGTEATLHNGHVSKVQRQILSVSQYPYMVVLEMRSDPNRGITHNMYGSFRLAGARGPATETPTVVEPIRPGAPALPNPRRPRNSRNPHAAHRRPARRPHL